MYKHYTQFRPTPPTLTEKNLLDQTGKVFIVTGGNGGVGLELVKILYAKGAKVYIACRSQSKAEKAIESLESYPTQTPGQLKYIHLNLEDLSSIKASAEAFSAAEDKLDVLWNNAGISVGNKAAGEGYEVLQRINCVGPFLFTQLLLPLLRAAAKTAPQDSVRIIWTSSWLVDFRAPNGGIDFKELSIQNLSTDEIRTYAASKAGNWFLASEFARRYREDDIISITQNPGNIRTDIWKKADKITQILTSPILYDAKYGAYTELWAGLSSEITAADSGRYAVPWGRWHIEPRKDLLQALKSGEEGGTGEAARFWNWCEEQIKSYS